MCIETLRKYPPAAILNRQCTIDYTVPNTQTKIAAGTHIVIPVWSIQHDSNYYPNPELFDPDRFLLDSDEQRPRGTYMPFGDGPRYCLGMIILSRFNRY